ncbi:MAG: hypothetical protein F4213_05590 [Boseongicola sp. SB0677_bin_26]|nr:hypothetical protein [Boseongicola sp. SB0677_bin_26]
MTRSHGIPALATSVLLWTGTAAECLAQGVQPASTAILAMVKEAESLNLLDSVEYVDLNADGSMEAFVLSREQTEGPHGVMLRAWEVLADGPGAHARLAGGGYGADPQVIPGRTGGAAIHVDGAWWHYDREAGQLRPFGDVTEANGAFYGDGRVGDERHFQDFDVGKVHLELMSRLTFRIDGMPGQMTLLQLRGDAYWDEIDGSTPYVLLDTRGERVHSGWSFLPPSVFPWTPGPGIQVVEAVRGGYQSFFVIP